MGLILKDAEKTCRLRLAGQLDKCCAFLAVVDEEWECMKTWPHYSNLVKDRLDKGTIIAKGTGDWDECLYEEGL